MNTTLVSVLFEGEWYPVGDYEYPFTIRSARSRIRQEMRTRKIDGCRVIISRPDAHITITN